ncbi:MAG TPA: NAD(P)H-binding protein [Candidatus Limnocylindrales bacterium]|nr:NAD(P)H-binding protein [Candidatus Limnocylindrales bacterium]
MKVVVFGAAGGTGRHVVAEALAAGHEVSVLVRDPATLGPVDPAVAVEAGDARDPQAVAGVLAGAQGVISTIGGHGMGRSTAITDVMTTIVAGMPAGTRLLAVSTVGAGDSASQLPRAVRMGVLPLLRNAIADHNGQERVIMASDLDWTIARCVGLTDDGATGEVHVLTAGRVGGSRIARADVARWLVANLQDPTYSRQAVSLW